MTTRRLTVLACALLLFSTPAAAQEEFDATRIYLGAGGSTCTLHAATGAPGSGLGGVCDMYHRVDSPYTVYVKTGASTWTPVATLPSGATAGDLVTVASATATGRVAAVASGQVLASNGTGSAPVYTATPSLTSIGGAANLTLNPTGDVVLGPTGNDILPSAGYTKNLGALTNKYLTLHAAELWVETLVAQDTIATIGGRVLVGPTTTLTSDLSNSATSIVVKHNEIANGDRLVMQSNGKYERLLVTSGASGSGPYTYSVTRNTDGSGANDWFAGDAVFNTGTTGDGFIDLYAVNGLYQGSTAGPTIAGNVRTGTGDTDIAPRWAIGNLNGLYGYGSDIYGVALGDAANTYLTVDATNGIRMIGDAGTVFAMDASGNATYAGGLTVGTGRNQVSNTISAKNTTLTNPDAVGQWLLFTDTGLTGNLACNLGADYAPPDNGSCYANLAGTPAGGTNTVVYNALYNVAVGARYEWSFYCGLYRAGTVFARIQWEDASKSLISVSDGTAIACDADGGSGLLNNLSRWNRAHAIGTAPANAVYANLQMVVTHTAEANPYLFFHRLFFGEAGPAQTTPSPWAPGGVTLITGGHLATDMVVANTIRSSGATAYGTGTGLWINSAGTPAFRIGNPLGNQLGFDGTNTVINQGVVSIGSNGITVTSDTAGGGAYVAANAYRFTTSNAAATMGLSGSVQGGAVNALHLQAESSSASHATNVNVRASQTTGSGLQDAHVTATTSGAGNVRLFLTTAVDSGFNNGVIYLGGIPDFRGGTSVSAGSLAGYVNVQVGGTNYRLPIYNP